MPKVYLTEADGLNAKFVRSYKACTAAPRIRNNEVSERTGIPLRTLYNRLDDPSQLRISEYRAIARVVGMSREDIADFILGR